MTSRDLTVIAVSVVAAGVGIAASFLGDMRVGMTALFLLALLIVFLLVLQRRHQARVQSRILYLVNAEKNRSKIVSAKSPVQSADESNAIYIKKIIGLLQAQQASMERLRAEMSDVSSAITKYD